NVPLAKSLTPNLDTLVQHGRMFRNFYANGTRSVESIPALLNSMPEIFRRPTIGSRYVNNTHYGLPFMLKERGYTNAFFCGAHNGTMSFDTYTRISGIDNYFGMNEYPHAERDFNGYWGCDDGPILQWMAGEQDKFKEPFFTTFFSISNHHPFHLPKEQTEAIAQLPLTDMEKTVMYTDLVLGQYFQKVREYDWFENTIFIVTGDHCFHTKQDQEQDQARTIMDDFHVPLFVMGPGIEPGFDDRTGSHISLLPTLIECLRLDTWHSSSAISLLDSTRNPYVIHNLMGMRTLAHEAQAYSTNFEKPLIILEMENRKWGKVDISQGAKLNKWRGMDLKLRSLYQELLNARIGNRFQARSADIIGLAN
ncbi:MAG TPA: LTA synthase family protein, partial [Bacteroidetes bacterium]|nr:LTA synthase family protein [Bacteroidota bacterium]